MSQEKMQPQKGPGAWPGRIVERPGADPGGALLRALPAPELLEATRLDAIEQEVLEVRRGQTRTFSRLALGAALAVGLVLGVILTSVAQRRGVGPAAGREPTVAPVAPEKDVVHEVAVPVCSVQALTTPALDSTVSLIGPARARRHPVAGRPLELIEGRLLAATRRESLTVAAAGLRVILPPEAQARVEVTVAQVVIAASGSALRVERGEQHWTVAPGAMLAIPAQGAPLTPSSTAELTSGDREGEWSELLRQSCAPPAAKGPVTPPPAAPRGAATAAMVPPAAPTDGGAGVAPDASVAEPIVPTRVARRPRGAPVATDGGDGAAVVVPSPPPVASPPGPSELALEAELVSSARRLLRDQTDPAAALAVLGEHRRRFPGGVLGPEREVLQVEALLASGRRVQARATLDGLGLDRHPQGRELRVLRGELRGEAGDCRRALADFASSLEGDSSRLEERALFGRGACQLILGQRPAGVADLTRYLARFPAGSQAGRARQLLELPRAGPKR